VAVGSVFIQLSYPSLAKKAHAQLHAARTWTRRAGCDKELDENDQYNCCWEIGMLRHYFK
jgi:hypothetical protein